MCEKRSKEIIGTPSCEDDIKIAIENSSTCVKAVDCPRILIVNAQSMYDDNATGITLRSIFSTCDANNCLEVYYPQVKNENSGLKKTIESICLKEITFPVNFFIRHLISRNSIERYNSKLPDADVRSVEGKNDFFVRIKMILLGLINCSPMIQIDKKTAGAIDNFAPDIIYTLGGDILPLTLALYFSKRYGNKPILIHYMDNWVETKYAGTGENKLFRHILLKKLKDVQSHGNAALTISPMMARHYDKLFNGVKHFPLMNCASINDTTTKDSFKNEGTYNFVYAGGLHLNRYEQLLAIETAIQKANLKMLHPKGKLIIYTGDRDRNVYEKKFNKEITEFLPFVPHEQIQKVFDSADILVHVESFDLELIAYTKYSISTKISEYMLSGKPILCYAPSDIAVYEYIDTNNAGLCTSNLTELQTSVEKCINDKKQLEEKGRNGRNTARLFHTPNAGYSVLMGAIEILLNKAK